MNNCRLLVKGNEGLAVGRGWSRPELTISHEPSPRSDLISQQLSGRAAPDLPAELAADPFIQSQFHSQLLQQPFDLVILSIQPDIQQTAWTHHQEGYKICPPADWQEQWSPATRQWFTSHFINQGLLTLVQFQEAFKQLISQLKGTASAKVIVLNSSSFDPGDKSHNYSGRELPPFIRHHQFNLALAHLSASEDFYIVDIDRIAATIGAGQHISAPFVYSQQLGQAINHELESIAEQTGLFTKTEWLKLLFPPTELQIESGHVLRWHKSEGQPVKRGEPLFDYQADKIVRTMRVRDENAQITGVQQLSKADWTMEMHIMAGQDGYLQQVLAPAGQTHPPTSPFALLTLQPTPPTPPDPTTISLFSTTLQLPQLSPPIP